MKFTGKAITLAGILALGVASAAAIAHVEQSDSDCGGHMMGMYPMGSMMPMAQMQAMMHQGRDLMQRMVEEQDQQKRRELMQQHMDSMHGQMMGSYMHPGEDAQMGPGRMQQQMEMMNQRMDRMQQMMEQMQQQQVE